MEIIFRVLLFQGKEIEFLTVENKEGGISHKLMPSFRKHVGSNSA